MENFNLDEYSKPKEEFRIPDGYFDTLPDAVFSRLGRPEVKVVRMRNSRTWLYAAAAVLAMGLVLPTVLDFTDSGPDNASIENYLSTESGLTQYDLAELLTEDDISRIDSELNVDDSAIEAVLSENANLENYIAD